MSAAHALSEDRLLAEVRARDDALYRLETFDNSLVMETLVNTKLSRDRLKRMGPRTAMMDHPYVQKRAAQPFKRYQGAAQIPLEDYRDTPLGTGLDALARTRKSTKDYRDQPVSLMHLGALLFNSYGVMRTELLHADRIPWRFRPIPSPGGLFASEIYVVALNSDLDRGLYHYRPDLNALECVRTGDFTEFVRRSCGVEPYIAPLEALGAAVITTSLIERLYIKYGERSYKFMLIETGLLAQQLSLCAHALGLGSCMLGGYLDDEVHAFLGVDGVLESVQNLMVVGVPDG